MKQHGRFVAGVFGASVLLALGTGAFLTANDVGAKEAKAAGEDLVFTLTYENFGILNPASSGTISVADESGTTNVDFQYKTETRKGYIFLKPNCWITNSTVPEGYYISKVSEHIPAAFLGLLPLGFLSGLNALLRAIPISMSNSRLSNPAALRGLTRIPSIAMPM